MRHLPGYWRSRSLAICCRCPTGCSQFSRDWANSETEPTTLTFRALRAAWCAVLFVVQLIFHRGAKKRTDAFVFDDDTGLFEWLADDRAAVTFKDQADIQAKKTNLTNLVIRWMEATC